MTAAPKPSRDEVDEIRAFNRFYTRQLGLLEEGFLKSPFSLAEGRILYELAHRDDPTASDLARDLGLDAGYLSRLLKKLQQHKLITRKKAPADGRQSVIALSPAGQKAFAPLDRASHRQIEALLRPLPVSERSRLTKAMRVVRDLLGERPEPEIPYALRPLRTGDVGWITHRQGLIYAGDYGWDETYEALVAEILSGFVRNFDPKRERAFIAERRGEIAGSVFLMRKSDEVAKLRLLYVEPAARGLGIGQRLVEECIRFARARGYRTLTLWTNDILVSARRIYEAAGFTLAGEERHDSFGKTGLVGQTWNLTL